MNTTERVCELYNQLQPPERGLEWLAEKLFQLAIQEPDFSIDDFQSRLKPHNITRGLFRSLMVRIASIGRSETANEVNLYGDQFSIARPAADGTIHVLDVTFQNTADCQRISIRDRNRLPTIRDSTYSHSSTELIAG